MKTIKKFIQQCEAVEKGESIDEAGKSLHRAATVLGRAGGKVGGPSRARKLSPKKRSAIAKQGARARWRKGAKRKSKNKGE